MSDSYYLPADMPIAGGARPDGLDTPFWDGLQQERLVMQRCPNCNTWQWGPEWICHECLTLGMGWEETSPNGIIYSWERIWHPAHSVLKDQGPYLVVLVELPDAGNVRVIGNLLGDPHQDVSIGMSVTAHFEHHNDVAEPYSLLQWKIAD